MHGPDAAAPHPRLHALLRQACARAPDDAPQRLGLVYPCDALALEAAHHLAERGLVRPVLMGPAKRIRQVAQQVGVAIDALDCVDTGDHGPHAVAERAVRLAAQGELDALMKGSLHTDELMAAVVDKAAGLRGARRISHSFVFDLPRYHKLLALTDCVVNIAPDLRTKRDILSNALDLQCALGQTASKVGVVAAVETVNPAIEATLHARELMALHAQGAWPTASLAGPLGLDNALSAQAARIKKIDSPVCGDPDVLLMPDLNAGNMLYKSFVYMGQGECAGLVLGARVPVVLTSRADSLLSRLASVALAVLFARHTAHLPKELPC